MGATQFLAAPKGRSNPAQGKASPRAPPWGTESKASQPCKGGLNYRLVGAPLPALVVLTLFPRALPWAGLWRPFRPSEKV